MCLIVNLLLFPHFHPRTSQESCSLSSVHVRALGQLKGYFYGIELSTNWILILLQCMLHRQRREMLFRVCRWAKYIHSATSSMSHVFLFSAITLLSYLGNWRTWLPLQIMDILSNIPWWFLIVVGANNWSFNLQSEWVFSYYLWW